MLAHLKTDCKGGGVNPYGQSDRKIPGFFDGFPYLVCHIMCPISVSNFWKSFPISNQYHIPSLLTRAWDQKYLGLHWDQEIIIVTVWTQLITLCFNMCLSKLAFLLKAPSQWSHWNQGYSCESATTCHLELPLLAVYVSEVALQVWRNGEWPTA